MQGILKPCQLTGKYNMTDINVYFSIHTPALIWNYVNMTDFLKREMNLFTAQYPPLPTGAMSQDTQWMPEPME